MGDTNQLTYALTTRFIDGMTGDEKGSLSIGEIAYFSKRKVTLCTGHSCGQPNSLDKRALSPVAGQATYSFSDHWTATGNLTWNPYAKAFSYESAGLAYENGNQLFDATYNYVKSGGVISGEPKGSSVTSLQQLNLSGELTIRRHVNLLGQWNHSWSGNATTDSGDAYLAGIEYNSCCWAVRLVAARAFEGVGNTIDNKNKNKYNDAYYIQFDLKGFGSVGNDDPSSLLTTKINGYQDPFDQSVVG